MPTKGNGVRLFMSKVKKHFFYAVLLFIATCVRYCTAVFLNIASTSLAPHLLVIDQSSGVSMWLVIGAQMAGNSTTAIPAPLQR